MRRFRAGVRPSLKDRSPQIRSIERRIFLRQGLSIGPL
jgi:hypothetical protein